MTEPHLWALRWTTMGLAGALAVVIVLKVML